MLVLQSLIFGSVIAVVAFYAIFRWRRRRLYQLAAHFQGPKGLPLIGIGHTLINKNFKTVFDTLVNITNGHVSPVAAWLGPEFVIFAETPEDLQVILNSQKCLDKSPLYDVLILTRGLLVGSGNLWRTHRKILNPAFSISVLQPLIPLFDEKSRKFVEVLGKKVGKGEFDMFPFISACSLETILKGTMEMDRDIQSSALDNEYLKHIEKASEICMNKMLNVFYQFEPLYRLTKWYQLEQKHCHNGVLKIGVETYDEKREMRESLEEEFAVCDDDDGNKRKPASFIRTVLNPINGLDEDEIIQEINTLITAGHETSARVMSFALLMLAMHAEIQEKVASELKEVFGSKDSQIDNNLLNKLVYLEMVIKETMRLFPVLPYSARKSTGEFQLGNKTVPSGATILISAFNVQRNEKYWGDDAGLFRPERFEPEKFAKVPAYAYIPFTGGPRLCIGWRYAMFFMKSVLSNVLRNYQFTTSLKYDELEFEILLGLSITQKWKMELARREF